MLLDWLLSSHNKFQYAMRAHTHKYHITDYRSHYGIISTPCAVNKSLQSKPRHRRAPLRLLLLFVDLN